jgi:hypothetical protein
MRKKQDIVIRANDFSRLEPVVTNQRTGAARWLHRCDAIRDIDYNNDCIEGAKSLEYFRCHLRAKFKVGAYKLCVRHAAILALDKMLGEKPEMTFWPDGGTKEALQNRLRRR